MPSADFNTSETSRAVQRSGASGRTNSERCRALSRATVVVPCATRAQGACPWGFAAAVVELTELADRTGRPARFAATRRARSALANALRRATLRVLSTRTAAAGRRVAHLRTHAGRSAVGTAGGTRSARTHGKRRTAVLVDRTRRYTAPVGRITGLSLPTTHTARLRAGWNAHITLADRLRRAAHEIQDTDRKGAAATGERVAGVHSAGSGCATFHTLKALAHVPRRVAIPVGEA